MKVQLRSKTYPGTIAQPTPELAYHENEKLISILTPWGTRDGLHHLQQLIEQKSISSSSDSEETLPPQKDESLNSIERNLKSFITLANHEIFEQFNKNTYSSACETTLIVFQNHNVYWTQVGQLYIILLRDQKPHILQTSNDLSLDYSQEAPLPDKILGIYRSIESPIQRARLQNKDSLLLYSAKELPPKFFATKNHPENIEELIQMYFDLSIKEKPDSPFWMGLASIEL